MVENFVLSFPNTTRFETFNDPENYYGIIFKRDKEKYEVLDCRLGPRLLINNKDGVKDIPFHMGTAGLLPNFIKVKLVKNEK